MLDSTVVCRRALGCEWGGINKDGTQLAQQESSGTSMAKERDIERGGGYYNINTGSRFQVTFLFAGKKKMCDSVRLLFFFFFFFFLRGVQHGRVF